MKLLRGDTKVARRDTQATSRPSRPPRLSQIQGGASTFLRDTRAELKKVVWPTRDQAVKLTSVVIAVSVAVGLFVGGIDFVFTKLFGWILGGGF